MNNNRVLMLFMAGLGITLAIIPSCTMSPGLAKGLSWLAAGVISKSLH